MVDWAQKHQLASSFFVSDVAGACTLQCPERVPAALSPTLYTWPVITEGFFSFVSDVAGVYPVRRCTSRPDGAATESEEKNVQLSSLSVHIITGIGPQSGASVIKARHSLLIITLCRKEVSQKAVKRPNATKSGKKNTRT